MDEGSRHTPQGVGHGSKEEFGHVPVLLKEAIDFLAVKRGGTYIDCTVGLGGHSYEIAKRLGAPGHLIGFDKDPKALERAGERLDVAREGVVGRSSLVVGQNQDQQADWPKVELRHGSFAALANDERRTANDGLAKDQGPRTKDGVDGILADLGVSSLQFSDPARGFSFQAEGPLDMRMNPQSELTADQVVNQFDERELADLIYEFGEERRSRRIARAIVRSRPIRSTAQLAAIVSAAARPMNQAERRIHPATLTFQALRIFVNRELEDLRQLLEAAPQLLKPGGRLVVISFHSLEDRIVKDAMREGARQGQYKLLTKKPVVPSENEVASNPRARSAKLRAAERV
ncbi:MAG TPA: 16S rRNA (cytosine(1402)-N(4))-methyltransferase RsmH [Terriglobales bacterium]|nr:16S rRNA (cytosine(1402)-N(4))-methyltransferase RsmH [Terriglobales bacterium]